MWVLCISFSTMYKNVPKYVSKRFLKMKRKGKKEEQREKLQEAKEENAKKNRSYIVMETITRQIPVLVVCLKKWNPNLG